MLKPPVYALLLEHTHSCSWKSAFTCYNNFETISTVSQMRKTSKYKLELHSDDLWLYGQIFSLKENYIEDWIRT